MCSVHKVHKLFSLTSWFAGFYNSEAENLKILKHSEVLTAQHFFPKVFSPKDGRKNSTSAEMKACSSFGATKIHFFCVQIFQKIF